MIEFVSYSGRYPNLCRGNLVLRIDGVEVTFANVLDSGGSVWFDDSWSEHVAEGCWHVNVPAEYEHCRAEITQVVNENVPHGCCGGCV